LTLNPFLNLSSLVRSKPVYTQDGRIGLPVYHEMARKYPQMVWFRPDEDGTIEDYKIRSLLNATGLIQPTLVPLKDDRVLMLLRDTGSSRAMHIALSEDNGWTWSKPVATSLPNPDSGIDALYLNDGRILLAYNHAKQGRANLQLAVSADEGRTWLTKAVLEDQANREFSYPHLTEDHQGHIHVTYTWQRQRIRHVAFNLAWLDRECVVAGGDAQ
jgi:predicted neuraminidase